jgi:hypothetical protein
VSTVEELTSVLGGGVEDLVEAGRKEPAERMAAVLLGIDDKSARDAVSMQLDGLAPIETPELCDSVLRALERRRAATDWKRWLDSLSLESVQEVGNAADLLEDLARKLWRAANADEPITEDELQSSLLALTRFSDQISLPGSNVAEIIGPAVAVAPVDASAAEAQARVLKLAEKFSESHLVLTSQFAPSAIIAIAEGLEQPLEPLGMREPLSRHVERWGSRLAVSADDASRDRLRAVAESSPWLPNPFRETLILAGVLRSDQGEAASPYSVDEVAGLVREHQTWFDEGLAIWITGFQPDSDAVGRAIAPLSDLNEIPSPVHDAIQRRFSDADTAARTDLVLPALSELLERAPGEPFLDAVAIQKAEKDKVVNLLASLYGEVGNNQQRRAILNVGQALGTLPDAVRKQLILEIVIPTAHQGKEALDLVIEYLSICLPPPRGTLQRLRNTLRERAKGRKQKDRVDAALLSAGLIRKSGFFGRSRSDVSED